MRFLVLVSLAAVTLHAQQVPTAVAEVQAAGVSALRPEAVVAAAGVKVGDTFSREALDEGAKRLFETGLFRGVNYRYEPVDPAKPGTRVIWEVQEAAPEVAVRVDVPGVDDAEIWKEAVAASGLLVRPMPAGELTAAHAQKVLTGVLAKRGIAGPFVFDTGADLATGQITLFLRLANAPEVTAFEFRGNQVLRADRLTEAMRVSIGRKFSEYEIRESLEQNVRPLYEEKGYLRVAFGRVVPGAKPGVAVVPVEEGRAWNLHAVRFAGDGIDPAVLARACKFPVGRLADWREVQRGLQDAREVLVSQGYLKAQFTPGRKFDEAAGTVELDIAVERGPLFRFGRLVLLGVPPELRAKVTSLWKLAPGTAMDGMYVNEFLRAAFDVLGDRVGGVSQSMAPGDGEDVVDVHITFRSADH